MRMTRLAMTRLREGGREVPVAMSLRGYEQGSIVAGWTLESASGAGVIGRWK